MMMILHGYPTLSELWPLLAFIAVCGLAGIAAVTFGIVKLVKWIRSK